MDAQTRFQVGSLPEAFLTPPVGVAETWHFTKALQYVRLTLTNVKIPVTSALAYGSLKIAAFPVTNILLVGCEANLTLVKGGIATGIVSATGVDVALGTVAASNTELTSTMANILALQECDAGLITDTVQAHSLAATPVFTGIVDDVAAVFLNVAPDGAISVDDSVTFSGTVDLFYFDLGNVVG